MSNNKYLKTDFRKYKLFYQENVLSNYIYLELNQLEILKILKALKKFKMINLSIKFKKLVDTVDLEKNEKTDFERTLPRKNNGEVIKRWEDLRSHNGV